MQTIPDALLDRARVHWPVPVADALAALDTSTSLHERRDRVVEVFRVCVRLMAAYSVAARVQYGPGSGDSPQVLPLLTRLRARGLTDGQWVGLVRELVRPWEDNASDYRLPELVPVFFGDRETRTAVEGLLAMRKSETVAHGGTGDEGEIAALLDKRLPQLTTLLTALAPVWEAYPMVLPLEPSTQSAQVAWRLVGGTPARGRWRRRELPDGVNLPRGGPVLLSDEKPVLALSPFLEFRRPTDEAVEELFFLDGSIRRKARYIALPSMAELRDFDAVWDVLKDLLSDGEDEDTDAGDRTRPYRGLASFTAEDAALFFGREEQSEALANRIRRHPLVTVTGASGSGKSSLLHAGTLPLLSDWTPVSLRPGPDPMASLQWALRDWMGDSAEDPAGQLIARCQRTGERVVVVVDQAEELLTLCGDPTARDRFAESLAALASVPDGPTRVVVSLREDFFARLATLPALQGRYNRQVEVVVPPDRAALLRIVVEPALAFGFSFEEDLADRMVDEVQEEPAALALLQFCADRLWEQRDRSWKRLTQEAYAGAGGVVGALASHADATIGAMPGSQQQTVRALLRRLVTPEGTRAVVSRSELVGAHGDADAVLDQLVDARLLSVREDAQTDSARIELAHEALIQHWEQLRHWLSEDAAGQRTLHALRQSASQWRDRNEPEGLLWKGDALDELRVWNRTVGASLVTHSEQRFVDACIYAANRGAARRRNTFRAVVGIAGLVALVFAGLTAIATSARQDAQAESERASNEALAARDATRLAAARSLDNDPTAQVMLLREFEGSVQNRAWRELAQEFVFARPLITRRIDIDRGFGVGQAILLEDGRLVTLGNDAVVRMWRHDQSEPVATFENPPGEYKLQASENGEVVSVIGEDGTLRLWRTDNPDATPRTRQLEPGIEHARLNDDGSRLVWLSPDGQLRVLELASGGDPTVVETPPLAWLDAERGSTSVTAGNANQGYWIQLDGRGPVQEIPAMEVGTANASVDGEQLFSVDPMKQVAHIWNRQGGPPVEVPLPPMFSQATASSKEGVLTLIGISDLRHVDIRGGLVTQYTHQLSGGRFGPRTRPGAVMRMAATETLLWVEGHPPIVIPARADNLAVRAAEAVTLADKQLLTWDIGTVLDESVSLHHDRGVTGMAFLAEDTELLTTSQDGVVRIWSVPGGDLKRESPGFGPLTGLAVDADRTTAMLLDSWGLWIWELSDPEPKRLGETVGGIRSANLSPDGRWVVGSLQAEGKMLWSVDRPGERRQLDPDPLGTAQFSPDSAYVFATSATDKTVVRHNVQSEGSTVLYTDNPFKDGGGLLVSPTGDHGALIGEADARVLLFSLDDMDAPRELKHPHFLSSAAFRHDGQRLHVALHDRSLQSWDLTTSEPPRTLRVGEVASPSQVGSANGWLHLSRGALPDLLLPPSLDDPPVQRLETPPGSVFFDYRPAPRQLSPSGRWITSHDASGHDLTVTRFHADQVAPDALLDRLWTLTPMCLGVERRIALLGHSSARAEADQRHCEERVK